MDEPKTKEEITEGLRLHALYTSGVEGGAKMDWAKADLYGADLRGANLRGANLYKADLSRADLSRANLRGANLYEAKLPRANLSNTNLSDANLFRANLRGADLREADLYEADLRGAALYGADLRGANFDNITMNWNGHHLIATRLLQEGDESLYQFIALIKLGEHVDNWCWGYYMSEEIGAHNFVAREQCLHIMAGWVKPGDELPKEFAARRDKMLWDRSNPMDEPIWNEDRIPKHIKVSVDYMPFYDVYLVTVKNKQTGRRKQLTIAAELANDTDGLDAVLRQLKLGEGEEQS